MSLMMSVGIGVRSVKFIGTALGCSQRCMRNKAGKAASKAPQKGQARLCNSRCKRPS